ncbi:protein serine/threonine/tyrosine kinase [Aureococcus anophagefferens]|nr:protein serine/threonine/tyrosine kinase [Aureococcus anophagefferens]
MASRPRDGGSRGGGYGRSQRDEYRGEQRSSRGRDGGRRRRDDEDRRDGRWDERRHERRRDDEDRRDGRWDERRHERRDDGDRRAGHYEGAVGATIRGRYEILGEAGLGTFGRVVECADREAGRRRVALKVVRRIERYTESAAVEAEILRDVNRAAAGGGAGGGLCVKLLDTFEFQGHFCLVFEKAGTSLYDFLKGHDYAPFGPRTVRAVSRQLLEALRFLHGLRLVHTDLKLENVLLRRSGVAAPPLDDRGRIELADGDAAIVVIDFGGATYDDERKSSIVNTRQYRAPEVILNLGWSTPSDLWSAGCIVAELGRGELLFATHSNTEHLALIERCVGPFPRALVAKSRYAAKYFDGDARSKWEAVLPRDGRDHVRAMPKLRDYCGRDDHLHMLLAGLLTIDPDTRLSAATP